MQTKQNSKTPLQDKLEQIGIVLGLLEETNRGKEWILHEIKKHGIKTDAKFTMNSYQILNCCTLDFIERLVDTLKGDDIQSPEVQMKIYSWFFSDIVAGSNPSISTKAQVTKIVVLNDLILQTPTFKERDTTQTIILPTGDGQAIGFANAPDKPLILSIELHKLLNQYNQTKRGKDKLLLRIGMESGPVFFIRDLENKDNVWGPGILITRRVMDMAGDMQIFAGTRIAEDLLQSKYKDMMHLVENFQTKYGEKVTLYNVYGEGFGSKFTPKPTKKTTNTHRVHKAPSNFMFNSVDIVLEITNSKTMQTHHTLIWDIVNISKEPKSKILYYIYGSTEKTISELNVQVTDSENRRLDTGEIITDMPYNKKFYALLAKPVLPKQGITLKLEYDWEEPDRVFPYKFLSGTKKINYTGIIPNDVNLKSRILKVDTDLGSKVYATPPSTIKRLKENTVVSWTKSKILPMDAYEFYW